MSHLARRKLLAGCCLALASPALAAVDGSLARVLGGVLRAGIGFDDSPMANLDAARRPDGLAVAVAELIANGLGVRLELVPTVQRGGRLSELISGRYDVLMNAPPVNLTSARRAMFSHPFAWAQFSLLGPRNRLIASAQDLAPLRVAVLPGNDVAPPPLARGVTPPQYQTFESTAAMAAAVEAGTCQAAILPTFMARQLLHRLPEMEEKFRLGEYWYAVGLRYGEHDLLRAVDSILRLADQEGVLQILHQGFLGYPMPGNRLRL